MTHEPRPTRVIARARAAGEIVKRRTRRQSQSEAKGGAAHANPDATLNRMWWIAALLAANPHLDEARRLYEQLKYPDAVARLRVARDVPTNTPDEQRQIADLLARSLIAQGRTADAEKAWAELLAAQPDAPEPVDASPKIREVFQKAKRSVYPADFVKLERGPSPPELLEATLTDPWRRVASVVLECSGAPQPLPVARHVSAKLPDDVPCTLSARDAEGKAVAQLSATHAKTAAVAAAPPGTALEQPAPPSGPARWPAVVLGILAVGAAAAGTGLAVSSSMDYRQVTDATPAVQTHALDVSARNKAAGAYGAFGAAAAAGVATLVIVLRW